MNVNFNIPMDKQAHFWWGMAMAGVFYHAMDMLVIPIVLFIAILKEVVDDRRGGVPDWGDVVFTFAGGWIGAMLSWVLS